MTIPSGNFILLNQMLLSLKYAHSTCVICVQCRTQVHPVRDKLLSKTGWRRNPAGKY